MGVGRVAERVRHQCDVFYGRSERLNSREGSTGRIRSPALVDWYQVAQTIEGGVQQMHAASFAVVGCHALMARHLTATAHITIARLLSQPFGHVIGVARRSLQK